MKKWMILCLAVLLAGCSSESKAAEQTASSGSQGCDIFEQCGTEASPSAEGTSFKEAYEALNGTERGEHTVRSVEIPENNPFQEITGDEAAALLDQDGEFYLYIGDEACPWCRSVIEQAVQSAMDAGIETIYYVQIWDADGNEVLRDAYQLDDDGNPVQKAAGTEAYQKMLTAFGDSLSEYTLTKEDGTEVDLGEKRIYAPNFFHWKDGKLVGSTTGTSEKQEGAYDDLTDEMKADEKEMLDAFFGA